MINVLVIEGNLTRDCEKRATSSGDSVVTFTIAHNERKKQGDQWVDDVSYFDCVLWGKRAEGLSVYLYKGAKVVVKGKLKQKRWESDGQKFSKINILAEDVEFFSKLEKKEPSIPVEDMLYPEKPYKPSPDGSNFDDDADIPF